MSFKNWKFLEVWTIVNLVLLGGMVGAGNVQAAMLEPESGKNATASAPLLQSNVFPTVIGTTPQNGDVLLNNPSSLSVQFSTNMLADGTSFAANRTGNYLLVEDGADGKFQTTSCTAQRAGDDTLVTIKNITYDAATFTSTLTVDSWPLLNQASYQLLVCASTRMTDTTGVRLNDGVDPKIRFVLAKDFDLYPYENLGGGAGEGAGIGDFNHDGLTDVVMSTGSNLLVYLKGSSGSLNAPVSYLAGPRSEPLAVGDLNNDGWTDVVTADFSSNTISLFLQQANGTLAPRITYPTAAGPDTIAVGDVTGDGLQDVVVSHWNASSIGVFVQTPGGTLNPMLSYAAPAAGGDDIAIGDVNHDGRNDVVNMNGNTVSPNLSVYLQNMNGTLDAAIPYSHTCSGCGTGGGVAIGDVTGDGLSDVVMSLGGNRPKSKLALFAQAANGQLQTSVIYDTYDIPLSMEIADINRDGSQDILVLHGGWHTLGVFLQKDGQLHTESLYTIPNINRFGPQSLAVGDINQDGALDVAVADDIYGLIILYYHDKPAPRVIQGGNTLPVDGEELNEETSQLSVQFDQPMKADGGASAVNNPLSYLLVNGGADGLFQSSSCTAGQAGDDTTINISDVQYDAARYSSTLHVNGGSLLGSGKYRLLICSEVENVKGVKLNGGVADESISFTIWPTPHRISGNAGVGKAVLAFNDQEIRSIIADDMGDYSFKVSDHWSGTVTPSKANYIFTPASKNYTGVSGDFVDQNYTASMIKYMISGNTGMSDVLLYFSPLGEFTSSDVNGDYSYPVPSGWTGTIYAGGVPGYRFIPESRSYVNLQASQINQDFAPQRIYTISGNTGAPGVTLSYVDGTVRTVTSDSIGNYSFTVPEHWSGTVTPAKSSHFFTPTSRSYSDVVSDVISQSYKAAVIVMNINNSGSGSLRQAIDDAAAGMTITFDSSLSGQTITLASELEINKNLTVDGSSLVSRVTISGNHVGRVISIGPNCTVSLKSLILRDGLLSGTSFDKWGAALDTSVNTVLTVTGIRFEANSANKGGAVFVSSGSNVTILDSEFVSNSAQSSGGAVYAMKGLTIKNSKFTNNVAGGGGALSLYSSPFLIENNTFINNSAGAGGAIAIEAPSSASAIRQNLFSGNSATSGPGGAIRVVLSFGQLITLENNTFYSNIASDIGGAIEAESAVELKNNTFSHNQANRANSDAGASLFLYGANATLYNNILANSTGGKECAMQGVNISVFGSNNLIEDGSLPCASLPGTIVSDPMLGALADNGGSMQTMALPPNSPAIDAGIDSSCAAADQRGVTRPQGSHCDLGAYEYVFPPTPTPTFTPTFTPTATPTYSYNPLYLSLTGNQTIGGVSSADEDILKFDGKNWSFFFDGSDVGVGGSDLFAFSLLDADSLLLSFSSNVTVNGITAAPKDVLRFDATSLGSTTAGVFSLYFDGSDVGFDTSGESIDSLTLLPDGRLLFSTTGNASVPALTGSDEDVLAFTPASLGNVTAGSWAMYFDGSDVGLSESANEDVDALDVVNGKIYLSTLGDFSVTGLTGADEDVLICVPTSLGAVTACNYSPALYFDGSTWGLTGNDVDAFNFLALGLTSMPANTPVVTPTNTSTPIPTATSTPLATGTPSSTAVTATSTATPTKTATPTMVFTATGTANASDLIFADVFENGNLSTWSGSSTNSGKLSVSPAAALSGSFGMQAQISATTAMYVSDASPNAESRYRARFYFDPNSITMANGDYMYILQGYTGSNIGTLRIEFKNSSGVYQVRARIYNNSAAMKSTNYVTISDGPHALEIDWVAASAAGVADGSLTFWVDGVQQGSITGIANDTHRLESIRLGMPYSAGAGTTGTLYFDAFESRRQTYIGP